MKRRGIITVLVSCGAALALAGCQQQPAQPTGGESRPETPVTSSPTSSKGEETQPPAPAPTPAAPSTGSENQPPATETNQPPSGVPAQ